MKNSNLFIAVLVSIGFIFVWDALVVRRFTPTPSVKHGQPAAVSETQKNVPRAATAAHPAGGVPALASALTPASLPINVTLKTDRIEAMIESRGARLTRWKYKEDDGNLVEIIPQSAKHGAFALETGDDLLFSLVSKTETSATFAADHPAGFRLTKTVSLNADAHSHSFSLTFLNLTKSPLTARTDLRWVGGIERHVGEGPLEPRLSQETRAEMRVVAYRIDRAQSWVAGLILNRRIDDEFPGPFSWVGVDNHHFLAALVPVESTLDSLQVKADRNSPPHYSAPLAVQLEPGASQTKVFQLYVGPKKFDQLKSLNKNLESSVNFGTFGIIAKFLLRGLEFFKRLTNNYGWGIVLLTIAIQILVFPLTRKSLQHSVRMKELQPQIKQLQEQLKNDPKRMQIEMLNLYRKNGMKLMGMEGCFPVLLQIPVFFAFYKTLNLAYELRGASWLWITDLGTFDPMYILPILMGIGMFFQQRMTTVSADPVQAKMMMFMPMIMTFMFLKLPAGLVLYWSVNSLCTILIQKFLQWRQHTTALQTT